MSSDFLQPQTVAALGARSFVYTLPTVVVPAASGSVPGRLESVQIPFQAGYHFFAERVFMEYTCGNPGVAGTDTSSMQVQIRDASNNVSLTANYVPVRLMAAPGRYSVSGQISPMVSGALMVDGFSLPAFFQANGGILHDLRQGEAYPQEFAAAYRGWLIPTSRVAGAPELAAVIADNQASSPWVD